MEGKATAAEWCQHDDIVLHAEIGGENVAVHVRIAGLTTPDVMTEWHKERAGRVRLLGNDGEMIRVMVIGPPCPWRVERIAGNHGYDMDQNQTLEYAPNQSVIFTLSVDEIPF